MLCHLQQPVQLKYFTFTYFICSGHEHHNKCIFIVKIRAISLEIAVYHSSLIMLKILFYCIIPSFSAPVSKALKLSIQNYG